MEKQDWKAVAAIAAVYGVMELSGVTCPIRYLTGVSCPGCGMSRAWLALIRLDFTAAAGWHPLYWLPIPGAALLLNRKRLPKALVRWSIVLGCVLMIWVYVNRLLDPADAAAVFRPEEGLFVRLLAAVQEGLGG